MRLGMYICGWNGYLVLGTTRYCSYGGGIVLVLILGTRRNILHWTNRRLPPQETSTYFRYVSPCTSCVYEDTPILLIRGLIGEYIAGVNNCHWRNCVSVRGHCGFLRRRLAGN